MFRRGLNPWNEEILTHAQWNLVYAAIAFGVALHAGAHAVREVLAEAGRRAHRSGRIRKPAARVPERVTRHSLAARAFHWIMAASMLTLLVTSFAPILGWQFDWVEIHWMAGIALTISIIYHIIHASFWLDFWSIWLNKEDVNEAMTRFKRSMGGNAPAPRKSGEVSVGQQDVSHGHRAVGAGGRADRPLHDGARAHAVLGSQSVSLHRRHMGLDVRAPRPVGHRPRRADDRAYLLRDSPRKIHTLISCNYHQVTG